jgi:prolyl 4-hydroxylase
MGSKDDDELLCKETESYDDDDVMSDDEEDSGTGWKDAIVWTEWRQHAIAVIVAILATILMTVWQQTGESHSNNDFGYDTSLSPVYASTFRHEHLDAYQRTANISFCLSSPLRNPPVESVDDHHQHHQELQLLEFHLPMESINAFLLHYLADSMEDDDYSRVLGKHDNQLPLPNTIQNPQYHCLRQAQQTTNKSYVQGTTYFYQPPTFTDMFPHVNEQHKTASSAPSLQGLNPWDNNNNNKKRQGEPAHLSFTGFAAKFINLSPQPVLLYWDGKGGHGKAARLVGEIAPFDSLGTATTPGQSFSVSPVYDPAHALHRWVVTADEAILVYEDDVASKKRNSWTIAETQLYHLQKVNLEFAQRYLMASHRHWLAHFPRPFPVHPMLPARYVGQSHAVSLEDEDNSSRRTVTMQVVSVTPRVLAMDNFLTLDECQALMSLAAAQGLKGSTLYTGGMAQQQRDVSTRSSTNAWLSRETSALTDRIYRRAAQILKMKESLLQQPPFYRDEEKEEEDRDFTQHSIAESLQVVRYQPGEEYSAHHDFVYPSLRHRYQPTRYATLLLYLNDDFTGGQTNFPRSVNPSQHEGITITPKAGKAVLFYNVLPDGNVDDLSQHRSLPVIKGEKWLANLWIWDPVIN